MARGMIGMTDNEIDSDMGCFRGNRSRKEIDPGAIEHMRTR